MHLYKIRLTSQNYELTLTNFVDAWEQNGTLRMSLRKSNIPAFSPKSTWTPPNGHPNLEVYLSQIENEVFKIPKEQLGYSNLSKLEWEAIRSLAGDRSIVIKIADKGSSLAW